MISEAQADLTTQMQDFDNHISRYRFVDIGRLNVIHEDGTADVTLPDMYLKNIPLYRPGNSYGVFGHMDEGSPVLVISPRENVRGEAMYSTYKAILLGDCYKQEVEAGFSPDGYHIASCNYEVSYAQDSITETAGGYTKSLSGQGIYRGDAQYSDFIKEGSYTSMSVDEELAVLNTYKHSSEGFSWTTTEGNYSWCTCKGNYSWTTEEGNFTAEAPSGKVSLSGDKIEFNGNDKQFVTWGELDQALSTYVTCLNAALQAAVSPAGTAGGPLAWVVQLPLSIDISSAKTETVLTGG